VGGRRTVDRVAIDGGFITVADNRVSVFSQYGRLAHEISVNEAEHELMEADKRLNAGDNSEETRRHHDRATAQLAAAKRAQQVR
jgi:F-type H+-transporting ATPase subunit epsilon